MSRPAVMHVGALIAVTDLARARVFYEEKLGLEGRETPGGWELRSDLGTVIYLLPDISDAGTASWPLASFLVDDLRPVVKEYRRRGVPFLQNGELPFELDGDLIHESEEMKVAWFTDPDGSVLTLFELTGRSL